MASEHFKEEIDEIKENVKDVNRWIRGFFMLLFVVVQWFIKVLADLIALFQFVNNLLTGGSNERLCQWGAVLAEYSRDVVRYLTYNTEQRPFPFTDLPAPGGSDPTPDSSAQQGRDSAAPTGTDTAPEEPPAPASDASSADKPAVKKAARKKASRKKAGHTGAGTSKDSESSPE